VIKLTYVFVFLVQCDDPPQCFKANPKLLTLASFSKRYRFKNNGLEIRVSQFHILEAKSYGSVCDINGLEIPPLRELEPRWFS